MPLTGVEVGFAGQVRAFSSLANQCLERVGRTLGVGVSPGHYQELFAVARRTSLEGSFRDDRGELKYRFHGAGCEFVTPDFVLDFNAFPMIGGVSPIAFDAFKFAKFMSSRGDVLEEASVRTRLLTLVDDGHLHKSDCRDYFFTFLQD